jgi:hypothetical protein
MNQETKLTIFGEKDFLAFLEGRVSKQLSKCFKDGDLDIDDKLTVEDFLRPLRSHEFPRSNLSSYHWFFQELVTSWPKIMLELDDDPYDTVYVCSFYLLTHILVDVGIELVPLATVLIVKACRKERQLQAWCVPYFQWLGMLVKRQFEYDVRIFFNIAAAAILEAASSALAVEAKTMLEVERKRDTGIQSALDLCLTDFERAAWSEIGLEIWSANGDCNQTARLMNKIFALNGSVENHHPS